MKENGSTHIAKSCGQDIHEETPRANPSTPTARSFVQGTQQETARRRNNVNQMSRNESILEETDPAKASSKRHQVGDT